MSEQTTTGKTTEGKADNNHTPHNAKMDDPKYVIIDASSGQVEGRKYHQFLTCSFLDKQPPEEIEVIGEREIRLLGIGLCSVCEKRASGGPALKALEAVLVAVARNSKELGLSVDDERQAAWLVMTGLKERGVHLAFRKAK